MISKEFFKNIDSLAEDKKISREQVLEGVKKALIQAFKKTYGHASVEVEFDDAKCEIKMISKQVVVENYSEVLEEGQLAEILLTDAKKIKPSCKVGDVITQSISPKDFGRVSANSGKQMLSQSIRSNQKENLYEKYKKLEGEMIDAVVVSLDSEFTTLKIDGEISAVLPKKEKLSSDIFNVGDKIKVYLSEVEQTPKGPKFKISRNDKHLVTRLMEKHIPEIADGTVVIAGIARDPGDRSKVGVKSNNPGVDPIGACIGERGLRISAVISDLNGEKIDLYEFSDDPKELITNALQPSDVINVVDIDMKNLTSLAIVPDDQLSLAIGKHGQNVRLAVQSCKWKIDIKSESQAKEAGIVF